jgi:uncharacterized membrane protein YphA (DoxX/SURF4 family)
MKYFLNLLRILVGLLFIFSGLVKANDPLGLSYKMNEFFEVWGMHGLMSWSLGLSVVMIAFEIIAGVALLLGYGFRIFSFLLLLLILFFTFLTAYVLFSGKIKECGCFGDCIKISNTETFWKDVALTVMIVILFVYRKRIRPLFRSGYLNTALLILTAFFAFFIQWWALEHLPFYDCLPYRKGANIWSKMKPPPGSIPDEYATVLTYEKDGVKKEFNQNNFPWQDTTWKFVSSETRLVKKGNADPEVKDFSITDYEGNNYTEPALTAPGYTFLWFIKDPVHARDDRMERIRSLSADAAKLGIPFYALSAGSREVNEAFKKKHSITGIEFYQTDQTAIKTAMRANPGLMLLKDGTVIGKWSFRDYPQHAALDNGRIRLK